MADVIKKFNYSKTRGRGRGILGLTNFDPCRRPGERSSSSSSDHHQMQSSSVPSTSSQIARSAAVQEPPQTGVENGRPEEAGVDASVAGVGALSVKAVGPGGTQARVYLAKGNKKGIHNVKLDPVRHGKYRVSVKWSEDHIPGSPFMLKIYPGADASKCRAYGPGLEDGFVGRASSFMIERRDAGAGTLQVRLNGVRDAFKIDIKPVDQRDVCTLKANYNPRKPGDYLVTIKWSEKHIPGSQFRVRITGDIIVTDSPNLALKATPRDASLNLIAEEVDEENWGDEEDSGETANSSIPAQSAILHCSEHLHLSPITIKFSIT